MDRRIPSQARRQEIQTLSKIFASQQFLKKLWPLNLSIQTNIQIRIYFRAILQSAIIILTLAHQQLCLLILHGKKIALFRDGKFWIHKCTTIFLQMEVKIILASVFFDIFAGVFSATTEDRGQSFGRMGKICFQVLSTGTLAASNFFVHKNSRSSSGKGTAEVATTAATNRGGGKDGL